MAVLDYSKTPHPSGYRGLLVRRQIGGMTTQAYYPLSERTRAEAHDARLTKEQKCFAKKRLKAELTDAQLPDYSNCPRFNAPRRTPVVGLTLSFQEQLRCDPIRYYPAFIIAGKRADGGRIHTSRCISATKGLTKQWRDACQLLAKAKGLRRVPPKWYASEPSPAQFSELRKHYRKQGKSIPLSALEHVYVI